MKQGYGEALLGYGTATKLYLLEIGKRVNALDENQEGKSYINRYPEVFKGLRKSKSTQINLHKITQ